MNTSTLIQKQLLATKFFVPVTSGTLIARPRLTALLEEGLRAVLAEARQKGPGSPTELPLMDGGKPQKGVDLTDTSALWEE